MKFFLFGNFIINDCQGVEDKLFCYKYLQFISPSFKKKLHILIKYTIKHANIA